MHPLRVFFLLVFWVLVGTMQQSSKSYVYASRAVYRADFCVNPIPTNSETSPNNQRAHRKINTKMRQTGERAKSRASLVVRIAPAIAHPAVVVHVDEVVVPVPLVVRVVVRVLRYFKTPRARLLRHPKGQARRQQPPAAPVVVLDVDSAVTRVAADSRDAAGAPVRLDEHAAAVSVVSHLPRDVDALLPRNKVVVDRRHVGLLRTALTRRGRTRPCAVRGRIGAQRLGPAKLLGLERGALQRGRAERREHAPVYLGHGGLVEELDLLGIDVRST